MARLGGCTHGGLGRPGRPRHRALGADARARRPRRRRPRGPARDPVERPAHRRAVRGDRGVGGPRPPHRAHGQPRTARLHGAEAPLAPRARAGGVRAHHADLSPEGLRPPAAHRLVGNRRRRRLGNAALRRRRALLERGDARRARASGCVAPPCARVPGRIGRDGGRHPGRRRRGRPAGRRARRRRRRVRAGIARAGYVGCRLRHASCLPCRPACTRARLLPRRARCVERDGRDALCGRLAAVAARPGGPGRAVRHARRRGRALAAGR